MSEEISTIAAASQDFRVMSGDTLNPIVFQFFTSVNNVDTPIDITTDTFLMKVVSISGTTVLTFANGSGFTIQNTNELVMSNSAAQMDITPGTYSYDLERTQSSGVVSTELTGIFTVVKDLS